jgi:hypothetical protein
VLSCYRVEILPNPHPSRSVTPLAFSWTAAVPQFGAALFSFSSLGCIYTASAKCICLQYTHLPIQLRKAARACWALIASQELDIRSLHLTTSSNCCPCEQILKPLKARTRTSMRSRRALPSPAPWIPICLALACISTVCASLQPFRPVETAPAAVAKRQAAGCLPNFYSCANQGPAFNGVCCQNGQLCALDAASNPACCPSGYMMHSLS